MLYTLQQAMIQIAERSPDRPAILCRDRAMTYGEVDRLSTDLARVLRAHAVRSGDRVAIYAPKCVETAAMIYGILKSGAAYVPLDPTAPAARLGRIIQDCGIRVVLTHERKRRSLPGLLQEGTGIDTLLGIEPGEDLPVTCIGWAQIRGAGAGTPPALDLTEHDLAYILFTSGSTGEPKGIMHTHRSALAFAEVAARTYGLTSSDRVSNHAPLQFDLSTLDYFATAVAGATTVVIPEEFTVVPASLSELLEREQLTVLYCVPLALRQLLLHGALEQRDLSHLRWILFGGEPFPTKHLRSLMRLLPHVRFSNVYGPTEVNGCTYFMVPPLSDEEEAPIPIGQPYANVEALVVDPDDALVGPGEPGELLIRSGTRMAGYWGRPDWTERATYERPAPGGRVDLFHRTGDLVVLRDDGMYDFLGRKDRQIKTRGHRVELDEIETALVGHPLVDDAAAYVVPDGEGSHQVEAAVVLTAEGSGRLAELERHLRSQLPPYAVPARLRVRSDLPRTATGKVDRRALQDAATNGAFREQQGEGSLPSVEPR